MEGRRMKKIDLDYTNGWNDKKLEIFKELEKNKIDGSYTSRYIYKCVQEYSFETIHENERIKVIYRTDSSD
jgi:hypothetical protein